VKKLAILKTKPGKWLAAGALALTMTWSMLMGGSHLFSTQVATLDAPAVMVADGGATPPPGSG